MRKFTDIEKCIDENGHKFRIISVSRLDKSKKWFKKQNEFRHYYDVITKYKDGFKKKYRIGYDDKIIKTKKYK